MDNLLTDHQPIISKRYRYSAEEKQHLIQRYHASGQTKRQFCQQNSVSSSAFYRWLEQAGTPSKSSETKPTKPTIDWHPVSVDTRASGMSLQLRCRISLFYCYRHQ